tara:strand:- start:20 stop:1093 length:1074 start_codon:yes stop_codon:yes gene_type:complete
MAYTTIDDPSQYFQIDLYTGDGQGSGNNVITNDGNSDLQPDWIWTKEITGTSGNQNHTIIDTSRGINKQIFANLDSQEATSSAFITQIDTDGFRLGDNANINNNGSSYVAWQWKCNGGTTSSDSNGSITSTVQVNTNAGFSIVQYTGQGANRDVGHGLGVVPKWIIIKNLSKSAGEGWVVYHGSLTEQPETDGLHLNLTNATNDSADFFGDQAPSTTDFGVSGDDRSGGSFNYVAYCFTEQQGYNKFGSYTGNGNSDGPYIYTGFKPAWVMIKVFSGNTGGWDMYDNKRSSFNGQVSMLQANANSSAATSDAVDFLSNGFKIRNTSGNQNGNGNSHVYMAFAELPFVSSKGVPVTAR